MVHQWTAHVEIFLGVRLVVDDVVPAQKTRDRRLLETEAEARRTLLEGNVGQPMHLRVEGVVSHEVQQSGHHHCQSSKWRRPAQRAQQGVCWQHDAASHLDEGQPCGGRAAVNRHIWPLLNWDRIEEHAVQRLSVVQHVEVPQEGRRTECLAHPLVQPHAVQVQMLHIAMVDVLCERDDDVQCCGTRQSQRHKLATAHQEQCHSCSSRCYWRPDERW
mmetsp:Transcript_96409/g.241709  ORF Transcript_96409/g.241709 Transcript_96409/m.241709 type:complete len:217 (+) Transcript_96409:93-743(+)